MSSKLLECPSCARIVEGVRDCPDCGKPMCKYCSEEGVCFLCRWVGEAYDPKEKEDDPWPAIEA